MSRGTPKISDSSKRPLPSSAELIEFIRESPAKPGSREIARAFHLAREDRSELRNKLREIERSGALAGDDDRGQAGDWRLPAATVVEVFSKDEEGVPLARPLAWEGPHPPPLMRVLDEDLPVGARAAVRLRRSDTGDIEARVLRRLGPQGERIVGIFRRGAAGFEIAPADRRNRTIYRVSSANAVGTSEAELVIAEALPQRRQGRDEARILERIGPARDPRAASLLAIAQHEIPYQFPAAAEAEAAAAGAKPVDPAGRADLRNLPLVTIDGADARDFDDAVWAEPDRDPENRDGWHLVVAIADVAWYVQAGSALDHEALRRGNSVYFPDRVVPMLPPALSNDLCSLKPDVDRAALAVHLWIDAAGRKRRHRFERAIMRSAARLTYEEVQRARDSGADLVPSLNALYGAFAALGTARARRGTIDLDIPEHRVIFDAEGRVSSIEPRRRLDSHRLIEEFMILANVAAAEELEARRRMCMYRVHDAPDPEKLDALRDLLDGLGIPGLALTKGQAPKPALFSRLLERAAATPAAAIVNELVLRAQAQAEYSPANIGHFGLALRRYAHFTSPIRRYADLLVHRAIIGTPPLAPGEEPVAVGARISATERRAAAAERDALARYRASFLADRVGAVFAARITGIAEFGLFVALRESGADGLVPLSKLGGDYYSRENGGRRVVGRRSGRSFALGDEINVHLVEADGLNGRILLEIAGEKRQILSERRGRGRRR